MAADELDQEPYPDKADPEPQPQEPSEPQEVTVTASGKLDDTPEVPDGISVLVQYEGTALRTGIVPTGDVRLTEVPTILRIALKNFEREQGLS